MSLSNAELDALVLADIVAAASGETPAATPATESTEIRVEPPAETAIAEAAPAATPEAPKAETKVETAPAVSDEDVIEWRGQQVRVGPTQRKELLQKGCDYTQKTMELAGYRR